MVRMSSKAWSILTVAVAAALLGSCGGGGDSGNPNNPNNPSPTPPPNPVRTVLMTNVPFVLNPDTVLFRNVDNPPVGTLDVTVDWPGGGDLNLYVTTDACANFQELQANHCQVMGKSDGTSKPETVRFATSAGRTYTVWVHNHSGSRETGSFEVGITTNGPIPAPTPTPANDPRSGLAPGPVSRVVLYIYQVRQANGEYRDKFQDSQGRWILHPGEFVVFDSTQLNAVGDKCQWVKDPQYDLNDSAGVLHVRGSSQPFLFRTDVIRTGEIQLISTIDGIDSAVLRAVSE